MKCSIENCDKQHYGRTWCRYHYMRWYHHGKPDEYRYVSKNNFIDRKDHIEVMMSCGTTTKISKCDLSRVKQFTWGWNKHRKQVINTKIKTRNGKRKAKCTQIHRYIMKAPKGYDVDHINGDRLDNRRENLRICTRSQNIANVGPRKIKNPTSSYKGVSKNRDKWICGIRKNGIYHYGGSHDTQYDAAVSYNKLALELNGEYAYQNNLDEV